MVWFKKQKAKQTLLAALMLVSGCWSPSTYAHEDANAKHDDKSAQIEMPRDKWAVLIGVERPNDASFGEVRTAASSVAALLKTLSSATGGRFAPHHVVTLTNEQAT